VPLSSSSGVQVRFNSEILKTSIKIEGERKNRESNEATLLKDSRARNEFEEFVVECSSRYQ
jgi:hypothetical protein